MILFNILYELYYIIFAVPIIMPIQKMVTEDTEHNIIFFSRTYINSVTGSHCITIVYVRWSLKNGHQTFVVPRLQSLKQYC